VAGAALGAAPSSRIARVGGEHETRMAFGPVGLAGWAFLLLGILKRSRFLALLGLAGVVADVTIAELGGFKAMNETRAPEPAESPASSARSPGEA
jgi:predicted lipid-binding transport protein (Tim44 family)